MKELNESLARDVLTAVDHGLVAGLGVQQPGRMCIEAAVCFAYGLPHSDNPPCVGGAVRAFKIRLNDSRWYSEQSRAAGMRRLAIAQLGSDTINQQKFVEIVAINTVKKLLPLLLISCGLPHHADSCSRVVTLTDAAYAAADAADAAGAAYADAGARAAAVWAAGAAADAAAGAAAGAGAVWAAGAGADAAGAAAAARAAAARAAAVWAADAAAYAGAGADAAAARDAADAADAGAAEKYLILSADIALDALKELGSPGCAYLYLCDPV